MRKFESLKESTYFKMTKSHHRSACQCLSPGMQLTQLRKTRYFSPKGSVGWWQKKHLRYAPRREKGSSKVQHTTMQHTIAQYQHSHICWQDCMMSNSSHYYLRYLNCTSTIHVPGKGVRKYVASVMSRSGLMCESFKLYSLGVAVLPKKSAQYPLCFTTTNIPLSHLNVGSHAGVILLIPAHKQPLYPLVVRAFLLHSKSQKGDPSQEKRRSKNGEKRG